MCVCIYIIHSLKMLLTIGDRVYLHSAKTHTLEKKEPSHTVGGNVNWCSHCGEQ